MIPKFFEAPRRARLSAGLIGALSFTNPCAAYPKKIWVRKRDGSHAVFRLLSPHIDHSGENEVLQRVAADKASDQLADAGYDVPARLLSLVRDQGARQSCVSFALTEILETHYRSRTRPVSVSLGRECLVNLRSWMFSTVGYSGRDRPVADPETDGDFPQLVVQTIATYGIPREKKYPGVDCRYQSRTLGPSFVKLDDYRKIFSSKASKAYGKGAPFQVDARPALSVLKKRLLRNEPIAVAVVIYPAHGYGSHWGFDPAKDFDVKIVGEHEIVLTGFETEGGRTVFRFLNSWGSDWGQKGYGTMDEELLVHSWAIDPTIDSVVSLHRGHD